MPEKKEWVNNLTLSKKEFAKLFEYCKNSDIEFLLDDREEKSPVLFNRKIIRILNVAINARRKYVVTTKYSLD